MTKKEIKSISIKILAILFSAELLFLVIGLFFNINKESLQTEYEKPNEVSLLYVDNNKVYKTLKVKDIFDDNNLISHIRNNTVINGLNEEIKEMEADSAEVQAKMRLYTNRDSSVMEDIAHEQGLKKANEDIFIIVE